MQYAPPQPQMIATIVSTNVMQVRSILFKKIINLLLNRISAVFLAHVQHITFTTKFFLTKKVSTRILKLFMTKRLNLGK